MLWLDRSKAFSRNDFEEKVRVLGVGFPMKARFGRNIQSISLGFKAALL